MLSFLKFLNIIPKSTWKYLLILFTFILCLYLSYSYGVNKERVYWQTNIQKQLEKDHVEVLKRLNESLQDAQIIAKKREELITNLESNLESSKSFGQNLEQRLKDVISKEELSCKYLSDDEYSLYYEYTNRKPL